MVTLYDSIGAGYAAARPADHRITDELVATLGLPPGSTIIDVGAGYGKYSRELAARGFALIAVEPSVVMRSQATAGDRIRWIEAVAEKIPLAAGSADGAIVVLAAHHFKDLAAGLHEILRVIGVGPLVIFTFEPSELHRFWLADYFPTLGRERPTFFSQLPDVAAAIKEITGRKIEVRPFLLPRDLQDHFAAAGWGEPEQYLNPLMRQGISSFALMPPIELEQGLQRLEADLRSGAWDARHGRLRTVATYDAGYKFIVARVR